MMMNKMPGLYKVGKTILGPIFKRYYRPVILGTENIPKEGNAIIAGNHIHLYDQCHVIVSTERPIFYMAKKEYFDDKKTKWFFEGVGCIPVDRSKKDTDAVDSALEVLNNKNLLGIFPEGTRNHPKDEKIKEIYDKYLYNLRFDYVQDTLRDKSVRLSQLNFLLKLYDDKKISREEMNNALPHIDATLRLYVDKKIISENEYFESLLLDFKYGAVSLAKKSNSPIIPMVTTGDYKHKSTNLIVQFGKPFIVGDKSLEEANKDLRNIFIKLLKSNYIEFEKRDLDRKFKDDLKRA
jgi:1-acyl-sn-glycerol-3-phosphate acyltransferase